MARRSALSRSHSGWLLVLALLAYGWRIHGLDAQSLWRDEVDAIYFATRNLPETLSMFVSAGQNGPLYFLALRPWFSLVGTSEFALRLPSAWAGVLGTLLTFQAARRLLPLTPFADDGRKDAAGEASGDSEAQRVRRGPAWLWWSPTFGMALAAACLFAVNPYQLWYAQEGKMYALVTALIVLATWCWLGGMAYGGWRWWFAYWLTLTLAMYIHLLVILVFPLHVIWFLLGLPASRAHWRGYAGALAGLTLPYLPMVWWQWRMLTASDKLTGFDFTPMHEMARLLLLNHSRGFMPSMDMAWLAPIWFLGGAGVLLGGGEVTRLDGSSPMALAGWRRFGLLLAWVLAPVLGIFALSLRQPIFTDRYVIWIAPALMMLLALGAVVVHRYAWRWGRWLAVGLILYLVGFWLVAGWQQKTLPTKYDLRGAANYLSTHRAPDDLLILQIPHLEYAYRYYTSDFGPRPFAQSDERLGPWMPGLWTNHGRPEEAARQEVAAQMQAQTAGFDDVWVMRSEVVMWDRRQLMDTWLQEHGTLVDQAQFHGVQVHHYRLP